MGLFSIHSVAAASIYDLPAIAECTWHGSSLACAEMARRGLISSEKLPELLNWLSKVNELDPIFFYPGLRFPLGVVFRSEERCPFHRF